MGIAVPTEVVGIIVVSALPTKVVGKQGSNQIQESMGSNFQLHENPGSRVLMEQKIWTNIGLKALVIILFSP